MIGKPPGGGQPEVSENIVTPDDAVFPQVPVRGPMSMWAQADIIEHHQLDSTEGLRYSEMPRQVPSVDEAGNPVLGEDGEPVMVPNAARASWINATTLTTALNLGLLAYALSALALVVGITMVASGVTFLSLRKAFDRLTDTARSPPRPEWTDGWAQADPRRVPTSS